MNKFWFLTVIALLIAQAHFSQACDDDDGQVLCGDSLECVKEDRLCDGWIDCANQWDEAPVPQYNYICIPPNWVCDDENDCPGGEDEIGDCTCLGVLKFAV